MSDPLADSDPAPGISVRVTDLKSSDALVFEDGEGQPVLLIRRQQPFYSAVESVQRALEVPREQAERIIRTYHPEACAWGEQHSAGWVDFAATECPLQTTPTQPEAADQEEVQKPRLRLVPRWAVTAVAAVAALGIGYALPKAASDVPQALPDSRDVADQSVQVAQPYASDAFRQFAADGEMACIPTGPLQARCVDVDGKTMYSEASIGSDWTSFAFTYDNGANRIGLRVFVNEAAARLWVTEDASKASMPNLVQHGRYALWGTDKPRIAEYLELLGDFKPTAGHTMLHGSSPAPSTRATGGRHAGRPEQVTDAAVKHSSPGGNRPRHAKTARAGARQTGATTAPGQVYAHTEARSAVAARPSATTDSDRAHAPEEPMPRRLAALALGTLGIDPTNPPTLEHAKTLRQMGTLVAVNIVMGMPPEDTGLPAEDLPVLGGDSSAATGDEAIGDESFAPAARAEASPVEEPATPVTRSPRPTAQPPSPAKERKPATEQPTTPADQPEPTSPLPPTPDLPNTETPEPQRPTDQPAEPSTSPDSTDPTKTSKGDNTDDCRPELPEGREDDDAPTLLVKVEARLQKLADDLASSVGEPPQF